jgi:hypothetical protein
VIALSVRHKLPDGETGRLEELAHIIGNSAAISIA